MCRRASPENAQQTGRPFRRKDSHTWYDSNSQRPLKSFVVGGDYRQTLPIQEGAVKSELLDLSLKSSPLWEHFKENLFTLTENIRLNADQEDLSRFQMSVGNGATNDGDEGLVVLPQQCYTDEDLITEAYADLIRGEVTQEALPEYLHGRCILAVLNSVCDEYNQRVMGLIPGDACTYTSVNRLVPDNSTSQLLEEMPPEVMESVNPSGLPPHELKLKVGAVVIVMRNLNVSESLCNGTRLLVTRLGHRVIEAVHISGSLRGKKVWIPRIKLPSNQSNAKLPFLFERTQFPIRPAFCLTINKSQVSFICKEPDKHAVFRARHLITLQWTCVLKCFLMDR